MDCIVVAEDGITVPKYWFGTGEFCLMNIFLFLGFPLPGMFETIKIIIMTFYLLAIMMICCRMNTRSITFKKQIELRSHLTIFDGKI